MPASGTKLGAVAAALAVLLLLASSLCVVNCLAADNPGVPPCHRHAPSNARACSHTALIAIEHGMGHVMTAGVSVRVNAPERIVQAMLAPVPPEASSIRSPGPKILRI